MDEKAVKEIVQDETEVLKRVIQYLANFVQYPAGKREQEVINRICDGDFSDFE